MIRDLLQEFNQTQQIIENSTSTLKIFISIINFFKSCEKYKHFPPNKTFFFDLIPVLIGIVRKSKLNFIDPKILRDAILIFEMAEKVYDDSIVLTEIEKVKTILKINYLRLALYLGKINSLDEVFENTKNRTDVDNKLSSSVDNIESENSESLLPINYYNENFQLRFINEIKTEIERINTYYDNSANILLVEDESDSDFSLGTIEKIESFISHTRIDENKIALENIVDLQNSFSNESLQNIAHAVDKLFIKKGLFNQFKHKFIRLRFEQVQNIYSGTSFYLGAVAAVFCNLYNSLNRFEKFVIPNTVAFTGSIDNDVSVLSLPSEVLKVKLQTAFYSWIKVVVLPQKNLKEAKEILENLCKDYPNRNLKLIGIESADELLSISEIFVRQRISTYRFIKNIKTNNFYQFVVVSSIIFLLLGYLLANLLLTKTSKPIPITNLDMSIVYAPDREDKWIFNNKNYFGGDTINFGDVAVGDLWSPTIEFIHNNDLPCRINYEIIGESKDDFEIVWHREPKQPLVPETFYPNQIQRFYIKLRPLSPGVKKANLLIYNQAEPEDKKVIYLRGNSLRYQNGYAVEFQSIWDQISFKAPAQLFNKNYSIEFLFKPTVKFDFTNQKSFSILSDKNDDNERFSLSYSEGNILRLEMIGSKGDYNGISLEQNVKPNEWNYVAFSVSPKRVIFICNDNVKYIEGNFINKKMIDVLLIGSSLSREKIIKSNHVDIESHFLIDELKLWDMAKNEKELIGNRYKPLSGDEENLLGYYNFESTNAATVFDISPNDLWGSIHGAVIRKTVDNNKLNSAQKKFNDSGNTVLKLDERGFVQFTKNLFSSESDFTLQTDFKLSDEMRINPFLIDTPDNGLECRFDVGSINTAYYGDFKKTFVAKSAMNCIEPNKWYRLTVTYNSKIKSFQLYLDDSLMIKYDSLNSGYDISRWFYRYVFGNYTFFFGPPHKHEKIFIDNLKIFNKVLEENEILDSLTKPLVNFDFENNNNELTFDKINNYPALIFPQFDYVQEEVSIKKK